MTFATMDSKLIRPFHVKVTAISSILDIVEETQVLLFVY